MNIQWYQSLARFLTPAGWPRTYLVIDIETDGLGPAALPLQVAWLKIRDRVPVPEESGTRLLDWTRPEYGYGPDYIAGTIAKTRENMESRGKPYHITMDRLKAGVDPYDGLDALDVAMAHEIKKGNCIVGYNHVYFDLPIIKRTLSARVQWTEVHPERCLDRG